MVRQRSANIWRGAVGLMVLAAGLWAEPAGAVPEPAREDPRYALGYVVVTHYPGVRADGTGDSTAGIQAAIRDAYAGGKAVLFPPGVYVVSDTLKCYEWNFWHAEHPKGPRARNPDRRNHVLLGSARGSKRPLIRLRSGAAGFGDASRPRPILAFRVFSAVNARGNRPVEPNDPLLGVPPNFRDQPNVLFHSGLRGLDVDCGGNRGAVGVAFRAAQDSAIRDVKVLATGAEAGFRGIPGRNGGAMNIEVEGGRYGLDLVDGGLAGTIAVGLRLANQVERAIRTRDFCPLTVVGFHIVKARGPVVRLEAPYRGMAVGTLCMVDGIIELPGGGLAIDNSPAGKTLYLRDVHVRGAGELVRSGTRPAIRGCGGWARIREYACTDQRVPKGPAPYRKGDRQFRMWSLIDGELGREPEPIASVDRDADPPPDDLLDRHVWKERLVCEGGDAKACVVTADRFGAVADDGKDDRPAIQAAIDAAGRAGHGRVFLPAGTYDIADTLELGPSTCLFGVGRLISTVRGHESWLPTAGEPTLVRTASDPNARTTLAFLTLSARTRGGGLNEAGAHAADRFNHLHWRAGRHSVIAGVNLTKDWVREVHANAHDYVKVSGAGGGRFYFLAPSWRRFGGHPDSRALRVTGTSQPLSIYGLNLEFVARAPRATPGSNIEMTDAANVRIYSVKREMPTPTMILRDCRNVALLGHGRQCSAPFAGSGGHLQVLGRSDGITIAPVVFDSTHGPSGEPTLREAITGGPAAEVLYPEGLSVYKRGRLDDAAMRR